MLNILKDIVSALSNNNLSTVDNFIVWMNLFGASSGVYFNYRASHSGLISMRKIHFLITGLASIYCFAYLMLLFFDLPFLQWSSVMRGVSMVVWPIVWMGPAIISIRTWNKLSKLLEFENLNYLLEDDDPESLDHLFRDEQ